MKNTRYLLRTFRNQLIACTFGGLVTGFVLAIYLGAFSGKDFENLSDWIAVLVATIASGISFYAVRLVAYTLKATQDTLTTTIQMANDQKRIGDAQVRPWVMVSKYEIEHDEDMGVYTAMIGFKNFGHTPAKNFVVESLVTWEVIDEDDNGYRKHTNVNRRIYIAPTQEMDIEIDLTSVLYSSDGGSIYLKLSYSDVEATTIAGDLGYKTAFEFYKAPDGPKIEHY